MSDKIILVAETGSDLNPRLAARYGVYLVPMHVSMGGKTLDDGSFPPEDVCAYYDSTGKVPQTSASSPADFERGFDEIHAAHPQAKILHLAYSAVTTCSYQNAVLASEERDYVVSVDTRHVSVGQAAVVMEVAKWLQAHPEADIQQAAQAAPGDLAVVAHGGIIAQFMQHISGTWYKPDYTEIIPLRYENGKFCLLEEL